MRVIGIIVSAMVLLALVVQPAPAAPLLEITKPPVTPAPAGPPHDKQAKEGQWFRSITASGEERVTVRTHEFYDNLPRHGGGVEGSNAIRGVPRNVLIDPATGNITAFTIYAEINNDLPGWGEWERDENSHGEYWDGEIQEQKKEPMLGVKLTAEFAVDPNHVHPGPWEGPYQDPTQPGVNLPRIYAKNHDQLAWYCWTPGDDNVQPWGGYYVPTWDFGDIMPGDAKSRVMEFEVTGPGILPGTPLYDNLTSEEVDLFLNRTRSLKISNWLEVLGMDDGTPYPDLASPTLPPWRSSNVSVFCNVPEPSTVVLLASAALMGLVALTRRRRSRSA